MSCLLRCLPRHYISPSGHVLRTPCPIHGNVRYSHYDVLGVSPGATQEEIKDRYYVLCKRYHPDVTKTDESASMFRDIAEAYDVLGNVQGRRMYDKMIDRGSTVKAVVGQVTVDQDYSQHLRDRKHFNQRSSRTRASGARKKMYSEQQRMGRQLGHLESQTHHSDFPRIFTTLICTTVILFLLDSVARR